MNIHRIRSGNLYFEIELVSAEPDVGIFSPYIEVVDIFSGAEESVEEYLREAFPGLRVYFNEYSV